MLADRYRIVALVGRGGMGEVYRAEDLKLGQAVALKFLPADVAQNADQLARFHQEVRVARQVSHPNVCRVYDIAEAESGDGNRARLCFLSMEYVDGEDLASLLRRIGRLPADKALELARQLCAGLSAAHDRGVLHRDLKPANVLIDGRGRVRIADFGLAGLAEERRDGDVIAGTPGYMAPEQYAGQGTSTRTDVYALGLVLYEMFTGKAAFSAIDAERFARSSDSSPATSPSTLIPDIDPAVERVIVRCLEKDPARRPSSAIAVAAALPGGDPLAAALAAGETPSPEMVAAAGDEGSLSPRVGLACLAAVAIGLIAFVWMSHRTTLFSFVAMEKGPEALADRARTVVSDLGYTEKPADFAYGYGLDDNYLQFINDHDRSVNRWETLRLGQPAAIWFWYRESPSHLRPMAFGAGLRAVSADDPPQTEPGMVSIVMDPVGRLTSLRVITPQVAPTSIASKSGEAPDWRTLFAQAQLPIERFTPTPSQWVPPVYADVRAAWDGVYPERPDVKIRVEAAGVAGKPVYFEVVAPWMRPAQAPRPQTNAQRLVTSTFLLSILVGGLLLARRNLRLGRGDRRGAFRVSILVGATSLLGDLLLTHDIADLLPQTSLNRDAESLAAAAWAALMAWVMYIAIEPYVRRVWPETLIGWTRLLAGRARDPLVGRDVLVGVLGGVVSACVFHLGRLGPKWIGVAPPPPLTSILGPLGASAVLLGGRHIVSLMVGILAGNLLNGVIFLLMLLLLTVLLRSRRVAAVGLVAIFVAFLAAGGVGARIDLELIPVIALVLVLCVAVLTLVRFGLLSTVALFFAFYLLGSAPSAFDSSPPYAFSSYLMLGTLVALSVYGFHTALGSRSIFGAGLLKDEAALRSRT
jgi:serine/threonine-protein kinase